MKIIKETKNCDYLDENAVILLQIGIEFWQEHSSDKSEQSTIPSQRAEVGMIVPSEHFEQ